ncbi:Iota-carrageenase A2 [Wenyingzhuangia fucanilytica]|nr:Iota-carrageenase A2 [Wenyingzhuangia fucanilytica]
MKNKYCFLLLPFMILSCSKKSLEKTIGLEDKEEVSEIDETLKVILESEFYTPQTTFSVTKNLVDDYAVDNSFETDDSQKLQQAIDDVSALGGGKLIIPSGDYSVAEINLKSNVHIVIDSKAVIRPSLRTDDKNYIMFGFGKESDKISNVSVTSNDELEKFTVDLTHNNNINVAVFSLGNVENFFLSNFTVLDDYTDFSAVTAGITEYNGAWYFPKNGIVKNANTLNADYGYGMVQIQAGTNILFKNLEGTGGVTLRLETGWTKMNDLQLGGVSNIYGQNISCTNGNAAVMFSPHAMHNGKAYVENITANSCGFAVRIEGGFVSKKYTNPELVDGTFEEVEIKNITTTFGNNAQLKPKHYKYMPCELRNQVATEPIKPGGESYKGPSIAGVVNTPNYLAVLQESEVIANGYITGFEVVNDEESTTNCE